LHLPPPRPADPARSRRTAPAAAAVRTADATVTDRTGDGVVGPEDAPLPPAGPLAVSVVIPTLNEAARIAPLLARLRAEDGPCEVILADGGSEDGTVAVARGAMAGWPAARVVAAPRGRGAQLAAGARLARGEVLLFLHADTEFPAGGLAALRRLLERQPGLLGGNFRLLFDGGDGFARWLTGFYAWIRRFGLYYGDSGIFLRRAAYDAIGGVRPIALMEDLDLVRRMERAGRTGRVEEPPLVTSCRRFAGRHPAAIVAGWVWLHLLFLLRVPPARLARLYDSERRRRGAVPP
jgi:rSAM/selenodomain-associated transferase 2